MDLNFSAMFEGLAQGTSGLAKIKVDKEAQAAKEAADERRQLAQQAFEDNLARWKVGQDVKLQTDLLATREAGENTRHGETTSIMLAENSRRAEQDKLDYGLKKQEVGIRATEASARVASEKRAETKAASDAEEHKLKLAIDAQELANKVKSGELASTKLQVDTFGDVVRTADKEMTEATKAYTATQKLGKAERAAGLEAYQAAQDSHAKVIGEYGPLYKQAISDMQGGKTTTAAPADANYPVAPGGKAKYTPDVDKFIPDEPLSGTGGRPSVDKPLSAPLPDALATPVAGGNAPPRAAPTAAAGAPSAVAQKLMAARPGMPAADAEAWASSPRATPEAIAQLDKEIAVKQTPAGVPAAPATTQPVQTAPAPAPAAATAPAPTPGLGAPKATSSVDPAALQDAQQKLFSSKAGEFITPMIAKLNSMAMSSPAKAKAENDVKAQLQQMFPDIDPAALLQSILDQNNQTATV